MSGEERADMARNGSWKWGGGKSRVTDEEDGKGWGDSRSI